MSYFKLAVVIARFASLDILFNGILTLCYLPDRLFAMNHLRAPSSIELSTFEFRTTMLRAALHFLIGAFFWFRAEQIANFVTTNLTDDSSVAPSTHEEG